MVGPSFSLLASSTFNGYWFRWDDVIEITSYCWRADLRGRNPSWSDSLNLPFSAPVVSGLVAEASFLGSLIPEPVTTSDLWACCFYLSKGGMFYCSSCSARRSNASYPFLAPSSTTSWCESASAEHCLQPIQLLIYSHYNHERTTSETPIGIIGSIIRINKSGLFWGHAIYLNELCESIRTSPNTISEAAPGRQWGKLLPRTKPRSRRSTSSWRPNHLEEAPTDLPWLSSRNVPKRLLRHSWLVWVRLLSWRASSGCNLNTSYMRTTRRVACSTYNGTSKRRVRSIWRHCWVRMRSKRGMRLKAYSRNSYRDRSPAIFYTDV